MTQEFVDRRTLAAWLGWTTKMVDDTADAGNIQRSMGEIAVRPFLEYAAARQAAGQQARANLRAIQQQAIAHIGPDTPLIVTGLAPSRDHVHRGASNIREYTDGNGRRVISRRDFFPNDE